MNEATTRRELIDPILRDCGWGMNVTVGSQVIAEYVFTDGRLIGAGQRGKQKKADYLLAFNNQKLAIIEAKADDKEVTDGLEQVKAYAECLNIRYVYSTNGKGIYWFDMHTGRGEMVPQYHSPDELFSMTFGELSDRQTVAMTEPYKVDKFRPRYYQENAINSAVRAISGGQDRALLTLATGAGKTTIAFQIAWKLYQAQWNRRGDGRRPRILFVTDRNTLIDQAMGDFEAFGDNNVRINGQEVRKKGKIPTSGHVFFSIYQAITGGPESNPYYMDYPSDYFDLVIIDECHRGGASKNSNWRAVLDHFSGAAHLGMTATPKRDDNVDTYEYFGNPLYTYSLKQGVEDGFLTPFKVKRVTTTMDRYTYHPTDTIESGEVEPEREYTLTDFNRSIYLPEREERMTQIMLEQINPNQKTIIFCNDEKHAAMIRDAVNKYKPSGTLGDKANYCVRVTASEGKIGDEHLNHFRDNEKMVPTILTTSQKLSTGVDARNVRFIVLMRNVGSMVEFKQIIGRGTRVYDGKDYFTIVDFYGNDAKFQDPEWDGEPAETETTTAEVTEATGTITNVEHGTPGDDEEGDDNVGDRISDPPTVCPPVPRERTVIRLADGKERTIKYSVDTQFYMDGTPVSPQEFIEKLFGQLPELFGSEAELRKLWADPRTREMLLRSLAEQGFDEEKLQSLKQLVDAEDSDIYDVLRYIAYAKETMTRLERSQLVKDYYLEQLEPQVMQFTKFVLGIYEANGENELTMNNLTRLIELKYHTMHEATQQLGKPELIVEDYLELQREIYAAVEQ